MFTIFSLANQTPQNTQKCQSILFGLAGSGFVPGTSQLRFSSHTMAKCNPGGPGRTASLKRTLLRLKVTWLTMQLRQLTLLFVR